MTKISYIIFLIFFCTAINSAQNSGEQIVKALQNKFKTINDLSADFHQISNGKTALSGKFYYAKENKLRLELKSLILVSDGETNWNYNKKADKVIISNYNADDPTILSLEKIINDYPSECSVTAEKANNGSALLFTPNNQALNFKNAKIYINNDNLISKMTVTDKNDGIIQIEFSNYKLNGNISRSMFTFTPPKGSKVIDLR